MRPLALLALLLLPSLAAAADLPATPGILVDGRAAHAQVPDQGRVRVTYDVRAVAGAAARVDAHRLVAGTPRRVEPVGSWTFPETHGTFRLDFRDRPVGVYVVTATAVDAAGSAVASPSLPVVLEYGGWRAWQGLVGEEDLRAEPPPFSGVGASFRAQAEEPRITLSPATAVVPPGGELELVAEVANLPEGEEVSWRLEGEGSLEPLDARRARYLAPDVSSNRVVTVRAVGGPEGSLEGRATVIVTRTAAP